jgi:TatD DNase family protein
MFIDTHCHLNLERFAEDYKEAIVRANDADVKAVIIVGADLKSSRRAVEISKEYEKNVYATVGIHPHDGNGEIYSEKKISELLYSKRVVAIGEIGLDYFGSSVDKKAQLELLNNQIDLAVRAQKPIVLHCREAYDDMIAALMTFKDLPRGVMHCYVGDWAHAQIFLDMGFYLSFTGIITFTKDSEQIKVVENTPLDRIMIETDSPWLAPGLHRGHRNEPAYVVEVAKKIAEIKKIPVSLVEEQTTKNAIELFKLDL